MLREKQSCFQLTSGLLPEAEHELAAFAGAVKERFGSEQARQSVEDWMEELEMMEWPDGGGPPDWRRITIAAAARLASRVNLQVSARRPTLPSRCIQGYACQEAL